MLSAHFFLMQTLTRCPVSIWLHLSTKTCSTLPCWFCEGHFRIVLVFSGFQYILCTGFSLFISMLSSRCLDSFSASSSVLVPLSLFTFNVCSCKNPFLRQKFLSRKFRFVPFRKIDLSMPFEDVDLNCNEQLIKRFHLFAYSLTLSIFFSNCLIGTI